MNPKNRRKRMGGVKSPKTGHKPMVKLKGGGEGTGRDGRGGGGGGATKRVRRMEEIGAGRVGTNQMDLRNLDNTTPSHA